jgi:hypothetical protein
MVDLVISYPDTKAREGAGLIAAARYLHCDEGVIITLDQSAEWQESGVSIKAIPAWLLG